MACKDSVFIVWLCGLCNLPWEVPASQSKPPVSAVTVEYARAASHIPESGT